MTLHEIQIVNGSTSQNANISYSLVGEPVINGTMNYLVNFDITLISPQINSSQSVSIWFLPNGTATKVTTGSTTASGQYASLEALSFILPFSVMMEVGSILNETTIPSSSYTVVNQTSVVLGSVSVEETVYDFSTQFLSEQNDYCGGSTTTTQQPFSQLVIGMGRIANSNHIIAVLVYETLDSGGSNYTIDMQITSLTRA